jgi:hypothetical protein
MFVNQAGTLYLLVVRNSEEKVVSYGMSVQINEAIAVFGIVTYKLSRCKDLPSAIINQLLQCGLKKEPAHGFSQVERVNGSAKRVYEKSSFRKLYSYWCRVNPLGINYLTLNQKCQKIKKERRSSGYSFCNH